MLAAKFFDDYFYNNAFYAKLGGVAAMEMNSLELEFLQLLNFTLFVSPEVYMKYHAELRNYVGVVNIPVYLSSPFPNSPISSENSKGNSFLSRPPSTSPFLPLVEIARFPTPPLLDVDFDPAQDVQSYYQRLLEQNSSVAQPSSYESRSPLSQRTFIKSSLTPREEPDTVPFGYNPPTAYSVDQISVGGQPFGGYCVVPVPIGNKYYPNSNQGTATDFFFEPVNSSRYLSESDSINLRHTGCHSQGHFSYQKAYPVNDVSMVQYSQTRESDDSAHGHFKRLEMYDPYRPLSSTGNNCIQPGSAPLNYSHQTLQILSQCPVAISQSTSYVQSSIQNENNDEYFRALNGGVKAESTTQGQYYSIPYTGHPASQMRDVRSMRGEIQQIQVGLSPLDFIRTNVSSHTTCGREERQHFLVLQQNGLANGFCNEQFYSRPTDITSLSSFSDDNCESGATTPASERSIGGGSGMSSRSSLTGLHCASSDVSLCSNSGSSQIFTQPGGSYYKQQQLQQPHYIIAS